MNRRHTLIRKLIRRIRELESLNHELSTEIESDYLTGLGNNRALARLTEERSGGWYIQADLDNFKRAQDTHSDGHTFGNRILQEFSRFLLRTTRRGTHIVCRQGGDEFVIWVPNRAAAKAIKRRIRNWESSISPGVTASAGIGQTLEAADVAMYFSKDKRSENHSDQRAAAVR